MKHVPFILMAVLLGQACSPARSIRSSAKSVFSQAGLESAQVGICLYDPASATYLYEQQSNKYFIPASNTKLFSLYAGLKYLGDSLVGVRYRETDTAIFLVPAGDPSFLHPAYSSQPVMDFLKRTKKPLWLTDANWQEKPLGRGWAWDDYNDDYMPERSALPVYGNVIRWVEDTTSASFYTIPDISWEVRFSPDTMKKSFYVERDLNRNAFEITEGKEKQKTQDVPFITEGTASAAVLLKDTVGRAVFTRHQLPGPDHRSDVVPGGAHDPLLHVIHSRPVDSLFRPMMYRSDNFFAEQTLLMVSNERLGRMNEARIIDTLLRSDLKDLPQRPYWVDGSGLSRNDLFTPRDFVWLLNKMKDEFGLPRLKGILPTGGTGTLSSYYKKDSGYIYAKTGSLTGVVALSGFLITQKDHLLIFSILINNHSDPAVRRKMEHFLEGIREKY
ncbi:D-alanyl-D-alanine carboxypeptidase [Flavitalea sp. BT771]|uniref:D-alanyl-D-alanine carboxypeptidase/D-alanyl-D-alanine-endopeptidase n=1 Tax=Flavitalea sp. BT771 TaxID=3063329 RepID=UPI0026E248A2|nr:D-alanyl-D-alanine carboxypeptidase [Flavitalea sp. BT771]MDO6434264.1 D-alanyl-D-alanine carboxypeptidase [Flavitalea sp. BT771]MDV6223164.1 D-alanyl-D-alanine carboxypeptidase [Flavitalea sp. BT771]